MKIKLDRDELITSLKHAKEISGEPYADIVRVAVVKNDDKLKITLSSSSPGQWWQQDLFTSISEKASDIETYIPITDVLKILQTLPAGLVSVNFQLNRKSIVITRGKRTGKVPTSSSTIPDFGIDESQVFTFSGENTLANIVNDLCKVGVVGTGAFACTLFHPSGYCITTDSGNLICIPSTIAISLNEKLMVPTTGLKPVGWLGDEIQLKIAGNILQFHSDTIRYYTAKSSVVDPGFWEVISRFLDAEFTVFPVKDITQELSAFQKATSGEVSAIILLNETTMALTTSKEPWHSHDYSSTIDIDEGCKVSFEVRPDNWIKIASLLHGRIEVAKVNGSHIFLRDEEGRFGIISCIADTLEFD